MNYTTVISLLKRISNLPRITNPQRITNPLGRWQIHNHKQTSLKIKYANKDNCGLSSYQNTDEKYLYMMGYESSHNLRKM